MINDFVVSRNSYRESRVTPSNLTCVNESMCKWYGFGGDCIEKRLSMYVAMERKPGIGCQVQNAPCWRSGIMMRLHVVTTAQLERAHAFERNEDIEHGMAVMKRLVAPWAASRGVVCADSYLGCVEAALQMHQMSLGLVAVVKTGTMGYRLGALASTKMTTRGDSVTYVRSTGDGAANILALSWAERERRYRRAASSGRAHNGFLMRPKRRRPEEEA